MSNFSSSRQISLPYQGNQTMETASHLKHQHHSQMTPEKLALIRLSNNEHDADILSDAGTVNAYRSSGFSRSGTLRSSRRQSSILRSSRMESSSYAMLSSELTAQAESKFGVLIDVITNASKEASSLRTIWERMKHERELYLQERETLIAQTTELTAELTTREEERTRHGTEAVDRRKQVEGLLAELTAAFANVNAEKERVAERDAQLKRAETELREVRDSASRHTSQYEHARLELETLGSRLKQMEIERDTASQDSEKYRFELSRATRERSEIATKLANVTSSFEIAQKDFHSVTTRVKIVETERDEGIQALDLLKDELKRLKHKSTEEAREAAEVIEKYEKATRELTKIRETVSLIESERDDHLRSVESLRRQIKDHILERDDLSGRFSEITQKFESARRELVTTKESLRTIEMGHNKDIETLEHTRESLHSITRERDELGDELSTTKRRLDEHRQQSTLTKEHLHTAESKVSELQIEVTVLNEKIHSAHRERDEARDKSGHSLTEINQLRERIKALENEKRAANESRSKLSAELEHLRQEYSEVTETVTSFRDDTEDMEQEIDSMRALLLEAREQRERAVSARESADKERDEYIHRYEEKCRELERFKESSYSRSASYSHSHAHNRRGLGELRTTRTITSGSVSRSHLEHESGHDSTNHVNSANNHTSSSNIDRAFDSEMPAETSVGA